jgi:dimethylamine/trimethylamine dehydrogenase
MPNVKIYLDSRLTSKDILDFGFTQIVIATGSIWRHDGVARWHTFSIESFDNRRIFTPDDIMAGVEVDGPVVLFDDDHYYMGAVLAEKLRMAGIEVSFVTPLGVVGQWSRNTEEQERTQRRLLNLGVNIFTGKAVTGFNGESAEVTCVYTKKTFQQPASSVVSVTARIPNDTLYRQLTVDTGTLTDRGIKSVKRIGDCRAPGIIAAAVYAGHRLAREMDAPEIKGLSFRRERVTI